MGGGGGGGWVGRAERFAAARQAGGSVRESLRRRSVGSGERPPAHGRRLLVSCGAARTPLRSRHSRATTRRGPGGARGSAPVAEWDRRLEKDGAVDHTKRRSFIECSSHKGPSRVAAAAAGVAAMRTLPHVELRLMLWTLRSSPSPKSSLLLGCLVQMLGGLPSSPASCRERPAVGTDVLLAPAKCVRCCTLIHLAPVYSDHC